MSEVIASDINYTRLLENDTDGSRGYGIKKYIAHSSSITMNIIRRVFGFNTWKDGIPIIGETQIPIDQAEEAWPTDEELRHFESVIIAEPLDEIEVSSSYSSSHQAEEAWPTDEELRHFESVIIAEPLDEIEVSSSYSSPHQSSEQDCLTDDEPRHIESLNITEPLDEIEVSPSYSSPHQSSEQDCLTDDELCHIESLATTESSGELQISLPCPSSYQSSEQDCLADDEPCHETNNESMAPVPLHVLQALLICSSSEWFSPNDLVHISDYCGCLGQFFEFEIPRPQYLPYEGTMDLWNLYCEILHHQYHIKIVSGPPFIMQALIISVYCENLCNTYNILLLLPEIPLFQGHITMFVGNIDEIHDLLLRRYSL